jgi:hypothetical protein
MSATVTRQRRTSRVRRRRSPARAVAPVLKQLARARRSGGPEDRALYSCGCGNAFTAAVSTSVGCPSCGETQAW